MRFQPFLTFPLSVALLWSTAGSLSSAVPAPFPTDVALRAPDIPRHIENAVPSIYVEDLNATSVHLVRRGCFPSRPDLGPSEPDLGPMTCDGTVPPMDELRAQIRRWNKVSTRPSAFYTALGESDGIRLSKCWVDSHPNEIPPLGADLVDPKDGQGSRGAVFFDNIVDPDYENPVVLAIAGESNSRVVSYQKLLSQAFAEESVGTAWIFTKASVDFNTLPDHNTWKNWEFPALTRNEKMDRILRTDPTDGSNPPIITTIWTKADGPQGPEPRGLVEGL